MSFDPADLPDHSGWRKRRSTHLARKAAWNAGRERRAAISLLIGQADEQRNREGFLAEADREHAAVVAEIAAMEAKLVELKLNAMPAAEEAVKAARARLDALVGDVERANAMMEAEAALERDPR